MFPRRTLWLLSLFMLSFFPPVRSAAQSIGGGIVGRVKDQSDAVVPAALVQLTNTSTGQMRALSTDNDGNYDAREVPPGLYNLTVFKGGFNTVKVADITLSVGQVLHMEDIRLVVAPVGNETVEVKDVSAYLVETSSPTRSMAFSQKQIREIPILTRDINNLALLAPGVVDTHSYSFTNTLVPFAVNGSRGRDANFIVDAVDNNEPLFGGAATQFTNTDLFTEYRILTSQFKAEFGRNSGSVVNAITERGENVWHGDAFWFGQRDALNAMNLAERDAQLAGPAPLKENILGASLGGPIKQDSTWLFATYQWDRARNDLSNVYPRVVTLPTIDGLNALSTMPQSLNLATYLANPTVRLLPVASAPCLSSIPGLPVLNPCTVTDPNNPIMVNGQSVQFGSFLVPGAGIFDTRDHQASFRVDHRLTQRDEISGRYLLDDLLTPREAGAAPFEVGFFDIGLLPESTDLLAQRSQNAGIFWTHAWPRTLHELRFSYSRNASLYGTLRRSQLDRETLPAVTVFDNFATRGAPGSTAAGTGDFAFAFPSEGQVFTLGSDSRPSSIRSNLYQVQDNLSMSRGRHSFKFGANFVRTLSALRDTPSDLGDYFYAASGQNSGFANFVANAPTFAFQHFANFGGRGGEELPLSIFSQYYFAEDDFRASPFFVLSLGFRYENFGQPVSRLAELNPNFTGTMQRDNLDFGPRIGFALGLGAHTALRGGYGLFYNPAAFDLVLINLQGGRISPFVGGVPTNVYPQPPFNPSDALRHVTDCDSLTLTSAPGPTFADCTHEDLAASKLIQPRAQSAALTLERQLGESVLVQAGYVGSIGTQLLERVNLNPRRGWRVQNPCTASPCAVGLPRINPNRGEITMVQNGARSSYHSLQASATKRYARPGFLRGLALTAAYTWSHMIDTGSEIFDPDVRRARSFKSLRRNPNTVEVLSIFAQDAANPHAGERGNSSFDRRHRGSASFLWTLPSRGSGIEHALLGGWELGGVFSAQTGQPFSPLNSFGACSDASGDGILTNDRPSIGSMSAPLDRIALVADPNCVSIGPSALSPTGYIDTLGQPIDPATAHFVQVPLGHKPGTSFQAGSATLIAGNAGRNILIGPSIVSLDASVMKNFAVGERSTLQFRIEAYNVLNRANPGNPIGNVFSAGSQDVPALAFGTVIPSPFGGLATPTPARVSGLVPENSLDAFDSNTFAPLFLSRRYMNTGSRKLQLAVKLSF